MKKTFFVILIAALASFATVKLIPHKDADNKQESSYDRVMRTGTIRCGYIIAYDLLRKDEKTGELMGPMYDLMMALAKNLNLKVEWTAEAGFGTFAQDLKMGRYDLVCTPLVANAARGRVAYFSRPIWYLPITLWVNKDNSHTGDDTSWLNDENTTFAIVDGTAFAPIIAREFPKASIYGLPEMTNISEMMMAVQTKKADATIMLDMSGQHFADQNNQSVRRLSATPVTLFNYQFPIQFGDDSMRSMLNVALDEVLMNGTVDRILDKYEATPARYYYRIPKNYTSPTISVPRA